MALKQQLHQKQVQKLVLTFGTHPAITGLGDIDRVDTRTLFFDEPWQVLKHSFTKRMCMVNGQTAAIQAKYDVYNRIRDLFCLFFVFLPVHIAFTCLVNG